MNDFSIYALDLGLAKDYGERLTAHIKAVQEFGRRLHLPESQLAVHDASKWQPVEFEPYALRFCSDKPKENTAKAFSSAWLHHLHNNPHHWQYWIFSDGFSLPGADMEKGVMEMPRQFALEMIADWHGAGFVYQGSWDIQKWLYDNMPKIRVHTKTADYLRGQLDLLGYADTVFVQKFAGED